MDNICDICHIRPATHTLTSIVNGRKQRLQVCDVDYTKVMRQRGGMSPLDSFYDLNQFFSDSGLNPMEENFGGGHDYMLPQRESIDIQNFLSEQSKDSIEKAAAKALSLDRTDVDTEHLLYALLENQVIQEILKEYKLKPKDIKDYIDANAPKGTQKIGNIEQMEIELSPRIKNVLENAFSISRELGHSYIGPEHLLIGLSEERDGMAGDLLNKYGLTPESLRQKTIKIVGKGAREGRVTPRTNTPKLDMYSRDLTQLAEEGKLDPVIGRGEEIETTIEILSRRTKNNPALIGEPGVGKTAIVEGLAQRIVKKKVPELLQNRRIVELSITSIVAGSKYRGEFEERIRDVIDEIVQHKDDIIVFIDELHTIVGAGDQEGGIDVSNVIKPHLARGDMHLIGATTLNEYQKYIEKDSALERRFQPVFVPEPTVAQTIEILTGLRDKYEAHHKVKITDEANVAAAELSAKYISNRFLPDKAIDLVDQAASRVRIQSLTVSNDIQVLDDEIERLKREKEAAVAHSDHESAKRIDKEIKSLDKKKSQQREQWKRKMGVNINEVGAEQIAQIVSKLTGIPITQLTEEEKQRLLHMEEKLHERVIGQEEAIEAVSNAVRLSRAGLKQNNSTIGNFLFLGPTGVGKTELAKTIAWAIFGDENALTRIDMSEYMERFAVSRLIGAPPGYVGYEEGGQLTEAVRRRPYSVILLDEIEKAHPDVYNILLQLFDEGRLTDAKGRTVNFKNTIIIMTSNVGSELIQQNVKKEEKQKLPYDRLKSSLMDLLRAHFKPEFLNRIDDIIIFHSLNKEEIKEIVKIQLEKVEQLAKAEDINLEFDPSILDYLTDVGYKPEYGARELKRQIHTKIESNLAKEMLNGDIHPGSTIRLTYKKDTDAVEIER